MARKPKRSRHKYNVGPASSRYSILWKRTFHSVAERRYADHLYGRWQNGEISEPEFQVRVVLRDTVLTISMIVDFKYFDFRLGEMVWDEFKGMEMAAWKRQKQAWTLLGPGLYRVTKAKRGDKIIPYRFEDIRPAGQPGE